MAERDGRVITTIRAQRSPEQWGIYGFAVAPHLRSMGTGRDLLRRACRTHEAEVTRLHLEVEVINDRALVLNTSLGFAQTSTEDYFDIPL